ncbi:MAG: hypothetical protein Q7S63_01930 [bacterium]|nr:hypothetical protein [bacterium]
MADFSPNTKELVAKYQAWYESFQPKEAGSVLSVDEIASKVAAFYEKIRGVVDWQEEHLLRKTAIGRILRRRLLMKTDGEEIAEGLLQELVRGGHFPNNQLPLSTIDKVQAIVDKYTFLIANQAKNGHEEHHHLSMEDWLLDIAASEIEESVAPPLRERALIEYMVEDIKERIRFPDNVSSSMTEDEKGLHIAIAVRRSLFHMDEATLSFHILEKLFPSWHTPSTDTLSQISEHVGNTRDRIEEVLHHPLAERFYQLTSTYDTPYLLLGDILGENPKEFEAMYAEGAKLEAAISQAYRVRLSKLGDKIKKAAVWSTLSIFATKVVIVLIVEVPLERYLTHTVNELALGLSIAVPTLLMMLLVLNVRSTSEENYRRVVMEVMKLAYSKERKDSYELSIPKKKSGGVSLIYGLSFVLSFGALAWGLDKLTLPPLSIGILLFFLSLVAFAGTRIRSRAKELLIIQEREGILMGIFDLFSLPIIYAGKWFSGQISRYNVLPLLLSFLVEIPFQVFVSFLEQWRNFLKEKKEEIH